MEKQLKISFFSEMRGGKDTASKHFIDLIQRDSSSRPCVKLAYGDELKRLYHEIFGFDESLAKDRDGYQWFGQTMRARMGDIWIRHLNKTMTQSPSAHTFISDMRQPNEYKDLKRQGFLMVRIWTPENTRIERMREAGEEVNLDFLRHETESHIDDFDYDALIINDGTLEQLYEKIEKLYEEIKEGNLCLV